ncbi:MAG: hypothetical protein Q8R00_03175 [Candidatus Nanoarchaeia archaeon]|nr:hypothetical protein [Candidatus Nanoarchaeia archaeon]
MKIPDNIFGKDREAELKKYLEESKRQPEVKEQPKPQINLEGFDKGDYIYLPNHNLYVSKQRTHFNEDWYKAHESLNSEGARMLNLREFADFLAILKNGNADFKRLYKEITEVRDPWRAEWLDASFKTLKNADQISYNHRIINGKLAPQNKEPLEACLMEDCKVDLGSFNKQGFPTTKGSDFDYWYPRDGAVAGFYAGSGGAGLDCDRGPRYSGSRDGGPVLGVRQARAKI